MSEEKANKSAKLNGKKLGIIGAALLILIVLIAGIGIYNTPANRLSRQLDLGQRYLEEQNYEQAVVEFDKAIAIDPMSVEAYLGLADAYEAMGDIDMAMQILQTGYALIGNERLQQKLQYFISVQRIYELMAAENYEDAAKEFLNMNPLNSIIYIPDLKNSLTGMGIGIDLEYSNIYYGNYIDGNRGGNGILIHVINIRPFPDCVEIFNGNWENNVPSGWGEYIYTQSGTVGHAKGNLVNGLWDGAITYTVLFSGETYEFSANFVQGVPENKVEDCLTTLKDYEISQNSIVEGSDRIIDYYFDPFFQEGMYRLVIWEDTSGAGYAYGIFPYGGGWPTALEGSQNHFE